jgi:biotin-(acetyl-CoA carboxylase) ligase
MGMPPEVRFNAPFAPKLSLPPGFRLVSLREVGDSFAFATEKAPELGAATLVHVGRFDLAEFAVVLEPDEPLATARRAFYAGMCALGDALAAHAPPEKPIAFAWPDTILIDGGLVGGGRLAWAEGQEDARPDWLVFGAMIRTVAMREGAAGLNPLAAALDEEGFDELRSGQLAESFSRHLLTFVDTWQERGFAAIARSYLSRLKAEPGTSFGLADNGDLLIRGAVDGPVDRRFLAASLARPPGWLDPETGGPK